MSRPRLYVTFTLDCPPAGAGSLPLAPATWEAGARAIDAYCTSLLAAGYPPTLFVTPETADAHAPLFQELHGAGVDVGLLLQPPSLRRAGYRHQLGAYGREAQAAIVQEAVRRYTGALGFPPRSARSAMYSANDATFPVLAGAGLTQTSLSSPGRRTPRDHAMWVGAETEVHFASASSRLQCGNLPLLEVPVTTDPTQRHGGIAPDLTIENGTVARWHGPLIAASLSRQEASHRPTRSLCFVSSSGVAFQDRTSRPRQTLADLLTHLPSFDEHYEIVPASLSEASTHFSARVA